MEVLPQILCLFVGFFILRTLISSFLDLCADVVIIRKHLDIIVEDFKGCAMCEHQVADDEDTECAIVDDLNICSYDIKPLFKLKKPPTIKVED